MTSPDTPATQLHRTYWAIDRMASLEGQDQTLIIEMSQAMLSDIITGRGLEPIVNYVKRYCDVIDDFDAAERIANGL